MEGLSFVVTPKFHRSHQSRKSKITQRVRCSKKPQAATSPEPISRSRAAKKGNPAIIAHARSVSSEIPPHSSPREQTAVTLPKLAPRTAPGLNAQGRHKEANIEPAISSQIFLPDRLHPGLLDVLARACAPFGTPTIEIFAARHHFDYTDRSAVRELALWFRDSGVLARLHQPLFADPHWSRHTSPNLNLISPDKSHRIEAMDETKRAIESAEQIPFRSAVLHLGMKHDAWSPRALENALTAIEHLKAFSSPLGVQLLLENLQNEVATPEHLLEILHVGHFSDVGICLDLGHAHLSSPITVPASSRAPHSSQSPRDEWAVAQPQNRDLGQDPAQTRSPIEHALTLLHPRIAELHIHDNSGALDEHLWPATEANPVPNGIAWSDTHTLLRTLPPETPAVLEISHTLGQTLQKQAATFFSDHLRSLEQTQTT